ncbi:MAG: aminomethyl-transferring glycine dehydrogenase [Gemmatimonadales bacterium]
MGTALPHTDTEQFITRHIGPRPADIEAILETLGYDSLDALTDDVVPRDIRLERPLDLPAAKPEPEVLRTLAEITAQNEQYRSFIGMGYANCITPAVIQRNILENPGWYTAYTPYQAEIAQGRLEALLNFQTMVSDLTGLDIANASLLDEATAAAEAMTMTVAVTKSGDAPIYLVDQNCHPQTIAVLETRAGTRGIRIALGDPAEFEFTDHVIGALVQYPGSDGSLIDPRPVCDRAHGAGALVTVATDLLALTMLRAPGDLGADIAVGNSQRFGVPLGYGGPHAAFFATRAEYKRRVPGRIIGVSLDSSGKPALRMALQTREQHIRRDKATSNICTAQVLLAVVAGMYATYHGPDGLLRIARRVHALTATLGELLKRLGHDVLHTAYFDTLCVELEASTASDVLEAARQRRINLRAMPSGKIGISLDETTTLADVSDLAAAFAPDGSPPPDLESVAAEIGNATTIPESLRRNSPFLTHSVFQRYRSETGMLRYLKTLEARDLSLTSAMIPLGSCTMKLNATTEMIPITWPSVANIHPFAPREQAKGYGILFELLEQQLAEISGLPHTSLQPNAGSQGEFSGLLTIRAYHRSRGEHTRSVCLIPDSAHGTNPASAVMAGFRVVAVATDDRGNIDLDDLKTKAQEHQIDLAALMVTYPSTHGVFESTIRDVCAIVHEYGGQVYMDGANLNAQVGLCRPGDIGADVCHINLHKTFCIPHGGGGPGMGPICAASHLAPFLPDHPVVPLGRERSCGTVAAAPWGSPSILPISWAYIALTGPDGQKKASQIAILNANYIAHRLKDHFPLVYFGKNGLIAHECIIDARPFKASCGVDVGDIAKRLMDYGFHAPTVSWPVHETLMVEPTESESKEELDRFCAAMIAIREEIREIEDGRADREINLLKMAPHTLDIVTADNWDRPYSRERAAFPSPETRDHKSWPTVGRVDGAYGDRNLVCTRPPVEAYEERAEPIGV